MQIEVRPVRTKADLKKFILLPWKIYHGNACWIPPLLKDMKAALDPNKDISNPLPHQEMFLALLDGKPAGRIYVAFDRKLNESKNIRMGHFSFFECINNSEVSSKLFDAACAWLKEKGIETLHGPVGYTGTDSDENKGLLIDAFDVPPYIMNSYNPQYYRELIEKYGFVKDYDVFAYHLDAKKIFKKDQERAIEYAKKKYKFQVEKINFNLLDQEVKDLKYILDLAIPDEWPDLVAPSLAEVHEIAKKLKPVADPDMVLIARSGDEPVGFVIALPDYNQVLIHMNGRMTPWAGLKYLWYKRKISQARIFIMFVIPAFRKKGVSYALYYQLFLNGTAKGIYLGEGSTIGENNIRMRNDIESFGGEHYKTYRIFRKEI